MKENEHFCNVRITVLGVIILALVSFLWTASLGAFCFDEAGKIYGIDPSLLQTIARIESGLKANAFSINNNGTTDLGLMQINSSWIGKMQLEKDELLSDPCYNVKTGAKILRDCIDKYGYVWQAVGCYNAVTERRRIGYSWKVYHALKDEIIQNNKIEPASERSSESSQIQKKQSLYFSVRSTEGAATSDDP